MPDVYYQIPEGQIAHEVIEGEVIILRFDTGFYFSLNGSAVNLWQWILEGASQSQILDAFEPLNPEQTAALEAFLGRLVKENLVVPTDQPTSPTTPTVPKGEVRFELPSMEKYGDMQDMLLADPIHEVDEAGWPKLQSN
jgi:hypothetical protein